MNGTKTSKDVLDYISDHDLRMVDIRFIDLLGAWQHFTVPAHELDEEAFARGTSTYLVDRVIPMLPEALSNEVCSLRPNEDKLTYSCLMTVTPQGEARKYRIAETVIHSQARLAYEDAQEIIDGGGLDNPMKDDVLMAASLARAITKKRMKEGSIDFVRSASCEHLNQVNMPRELPKEF